MKKILIALLGIFSLQISLAYAQETAAIRPKVRALDLFEQGNKTILGQAYSLPTNDPYLIMRDVEMPVGFKTDIHQHSQAVYLLILGGELEINYGSKGKRNFKSGQAYVEAIDWCHIGSSVGKEPLKMIAIYVADNSHKDDVKPLTCEKLN